MRVSQESAKVVGAVFKVKKELRPMVKDSNNPFYKSKYLELSDLLANLEPLLHNEGLFLTQGTLVREGKMIIMSRVTHAESGEFVESEYLVEIANVDPQKMGAAVSYGRRYALQSLFALNVVDDDGNEASGKTAPSTPRASNFNKGGAKPESKVEDKPASSPEPSKEPVKEETASPRRGSFGGR